MLRWSDKQKEFWKNANARWNIKAGATRSGKTFLDYYIIPRRIRSLAGKDGLNVILGDTRGTIQRNIIEPLQKIYGMQIVSNIRSDNTALLFGEKVYCLGAEKISSVDKIRGSYWKYMYGDELTTWHPDVFTMAKSRLDRSYSIADMTLNPDHPDHWAKKFIDSDADIFAQHYQIDDNPFLDPVFIDNLKKEYAGTIFYNRYILGQWVRAEGAIYPEFGEKHIVSTPEQKAEIIGKIKHIEIGGDFGGNKAATVYNACGYWVEPKIGLCACFLHEKYDAANLSTESIKANFKNFVDMLRITYQKTPVSDAYLDSAEQLIIKSMRNMGVCNIEGSLKKPIIDRIRLETSLFNLGRLFIFDSCPKLIEAFRAAVWDDKSQEEERLDNGTTNIDSLDAAEYTLERHIYDFVY